MAVGAVILVIVTAFLALNPLKVSALPVPFKDREASFYYDYKYFDINSQLFVINRVNFALLGLEQPAAGLGFRMDLDRFKEPRDLEADALADARDHAPGQEVMIYKSTFFLQGDLWTAAARLLGLEPGAWLGPLRFLSCLFTALALLPWLLWLRSEFGPRVAAATTVSTLLLTGLTLFAGNLFRAPFGYILPFSLSWVIYPALRRRGLAGLAAYGAILFLALLAAFMFSLEFATATTIAAMIPPLYFELKAGGGLRRVIATGGGVLAVSVAAFVGAILCLALKASALTGSFAAGFGHVLSRAEGWAEPHLDKQGVFASLLARLGLPPDEAVGSILHGLSKIMLMNGVTVFGPIALPLVVCCLLQALLLLASRRALFADGSLRAFYLVTALAMVSPFAWILLQFAHIAHHARFAPFLFAYPGLMMTFAWVAIWLARRARSPA